jgi:hypothetical protein
MTDRELLELAAKAAGALIGFDPDDSCHIGIPGTSEMLPWNPLTDDGDALRLFCRLPWMVIETSDVGVTVRERGEAAARVYFKCTEWLDTHKGDLAAATRRAIVRAAAAIGGAV